jgi:hypothetical protein
MGTCYAQATLKCLPGPVVAGTRPIRRQSVEPSNGPPRDCHPASGLNPVNPGHEDGVGNIGLRESLGELANRGKGLLHNQAFGRSRSFPYFMKAAIVLEKTGA